MISLTCTHCNAVLTMDDAFAGGACRCQHCGTIQTVPTKFKGNTKTVAPAKGKALYRNKARDGSTPGTGLDDLADAVLSSGLSSNRLRRGAPSRSRFLLVFIGSLCGVAIVTSAVVYYATRPTTTRSAQSSGAPENPAVSAGTSAPEAPRATRIAPNFCGVPLDGQTVIYLLDRGDSTRDLFGDLKQACYKSISTLGKEKKFQVIFWDNGSEDAFPSGSPTFATKDNLEAAKRTLDDVAARGKTDITPAFKKAINANPSTIVIATAKAWDLDDAFVTAIQNMRGSSSAKVHTIALTDPGTSTALKRIAAIAGGEFRVIGEGELREFGQ